ncbi:MAG: hypothetical protein ABW154_10440 [Dyella sp.]
MTSIRFTFPRRARGLALALGILMLPAIALAHQQETIGFEFEDYLYLWPSSAPAHDVEKIWLPSATDARRIELRYDNRKSYKDLEIHLGPFRFDQLPADAFARYTEYYAPLTSKASTADGSGLQTLSVASTPWLSYGLIARYSSDKPSTEYHLGYVYRFDNTDAGVNKTDPRAHPTSDVGPQATFSLDVRKVYPFFDRVGTSQAFPYFKDRSIKVLTDLKHYNANVDSSKDCQSELAKRLPLYCHSALGRGFAATLAVYLNDVFASVNASSTQIGKEAHPLYLRNIQPNINAVKEYFNTVIGTDPTLREHKAEFLNELRTVLVAVLPPLTKTGFERADFVDKYAQFLASDRPTGFTYGPTDRIEGHDIPRYNFQSLSDASDAVIKSPWTGINHNQYVYFEVRNLRTFEADRLGKSAAAYALPYTQAATLAQGVMSYLQDFHTAMLHAGIATQL